MFEQACLIIGQAWLITGYAWLSFCEDRLIIGQAWLMFGSTDDEPMAATKKYPNLPESPYVDNRWSGYWSTTSGRMKSIKNTKRKQESAGGRDDEQDKNEHIIEAEV